jgi:hypothetical protein
VLLITPIFDLEVNFKILVEKISICQSHDFLKSSNFIPEKKDMLLEAQLFDLGVNLKI